jgi:hypothetical protein
VILATLLVFSTPQAAVPLPAPAEDIVVLARLRNVRFDYRVKDGVMSTCRIMRSTGDGALDGLVCDEARACANEGSTSTGQMAACLKERRYAILEKHAALADAAETEPSNASN